MDRSHPSSSPPNPAERFEKLWLAGAGIPDVFRFLAEHPDVSLDEQARICAIDQAHRWRSGSGLPVERYFDHCPQLRTNEQLGPQLIVGEYRCRLELGARVTPQDFVDRFPHLGEKLKECLASDAVRWGSSGRMAPTIIEAHGSTEPTGAMNAGQDAPDARAELPTGCPARIGRYEILRILGDGGFGRVYLAFDGELQRQVAVKVPHAYRIREGRDVEAYLKEARVVANLDHAAIVPVYDFGRTEDGLCFTVSKFVKGGSLAPKIRREHYSFPATAELIATIADALHFAHLRNIVHRDVKPGNILLDEHGRPYLADFGIALKEEDFGKTGDTMGTPAYMSPEQLRGEGHLVDGRSDIFSLGVMMYELLTSRRPFQGTDRETMVDFEPRPPRQIDDSIPPELERICLKALSPRVSDRYRTARDLAEDLRLFVNEPAGARRPTPSLSAGDTGRSASDPPSQSQPLLIVPKGLRSFDEEDAGFFLELLPGPRDRNGLPESVHFWIRRIQERDPEHAFRVGLIYGPSGCGKTSFIKAGVMPLLETDIAAAYVEATPHETESRLLKQLRKSCPQLPNDLDLAETITRLRRDDAIRSYRKVVIIVDQFEQWLHAQTDHEQSELVCALRQCDGVNVQCIIAVRDDFWMAVTRFMELLEIPLIPGQNILAVDLFSVRHARKVLTALGRSYGALARRDDDVADEQKAFVRKAVDDLARTGQVVPVHLALFAEMVKDKPWELRILREVGGAEGVGFTFLEETFNGRTANPNHRLHQAGAQAVLQALLSDRGSGIKGRMRSYPELLEASGYQQNTKAFDALLRILDTELRLITPTDPMGLDTQAADMKSGARERHYHLTHDYLVPSLELWLSSKQKESRRGRAESLLAERARIWYARPGPRALPTLGEWLTILIFASRRARRAATENRAMLRAASRHYLQRVAAAAAILIAVVWWSVRTSHRQQAASLTDALRFASTSDVDGVIAQLEPLRAWANPLLRTMLDTVPPDSREELHVRLALLPVDPTQQAPLCDRMKTEPPDALMVIGTQLRLHGAQDVLTQRFRTELDDDGNGARDRFRAGVALALTAGDSIADECWQTHARLMADELLNRLAEEPNRIDEWTALLASIRPHLVGPLSECFSDPTRRETERDVAAAALSAYVDQADVLAELLIVALPSQHRTLFPKVKPVVDEVKTKLEREFSAPDVDPSDRAALSQHNRRQAHRAALLFALGDFGPTWSCLSRDSEFELCAFTEKRLADLESDPRVLLDKLQQGGSATLRAALLRTLGGMQAGGLPSALRLDCTDSMLGLWRTDPDSGVHSAAEWALKRWNAGEMLVPETAATYVSQTERKWQVAVNGHTLIRFDGPVHAQVGSMDDEPGHGRDEYHQLVHIDRSFAIAATETTMDQYLRFVHEAPDAPEYRNANNVRAPEGTCPINAVNWVQAVRYCQWLSALENLPPDQWCYPQDPNDFKDGMNLPADFLDRTGYRLPTEAEWEVACRAGCSRAYAFGDDTTELLPVYGWYLDNANGRTWPVGTLKPNARGLFDMHGNVHEWCHDKYDARIPMYDVGDIEPLVEPYQNVTRGGNFSSRADEARSANRRGDLPLAPPSYSLGFRIARTIQSP